jgi:signal transduction histidine kinase
MAGSTLGKDVPPKLQSAPEAPDDDKLEKEVRARDDFIGNLLHGLRNPLAPMYMRICHLTERVKRTPEVAADPAWLLSQLMDLRGRVEDYLETLARLQDLIPPRTDAPPATSELIDLAEVARTEVATRQREVGMAGVVLRLAATGNTSGRWNRASLERVCFHLLSNAIRYGAGNPVDVTVAGEVTGVRLAIQDRGIGIAPEDLAGLFQVYRRRRVDTSSAGFGVSLAIVRQLVEALPGEVTVESTPGEGSTFTITLPRHDINPGHG